MGIFKRTQKPALVLINPEAWNMFAVYREVEAYVVKHNIRRELKEFPDGHVEVYYYTRNPIHQFKMGVLTGQYSVGQLNENITVGLTVNDKLLDKARAKVGVNS